MSTQVLPAYAPRSRVNWSRLSLIAIAGCAAIAILVLLAMIIWMSLRTGVPGQVSAYTLQNYTALLGDSYTYRVMTTTLIFAAITIAVSVPFGFSQAPLNIATVAGIGFVQGMTLTPLAYVMISAALRSMNPALVEAAGVH